MATSCKVSTQGYFFLPVVSFRTDGICNGSGYILFLSVICFHSSAVDLAIRGKYHESWAFYMMNKPHCLMLLGKLCPTASSRQPPCSVSTLLVQHFLSKLDKEQPASGGANSAEHSNIDTTKPAVRKFKFKL